MFCTTLTIITIIIIIIYQGVAFRTVEDKISVILWKSHVVGLYKRCDQISNAQCFQLQVFSTVKCDNNQGEEALVNGIRPKFWLYLLR
ncbi:hypothetical protein F5Y11DRAFT_269636 [Daldinia sp. FL1419]|nr:hypothetical protein F5Y11DRAFT_269636 [Daldinia sp. FL1419]